MSFFVEKVEGKKWILFLCIYQIWRITLRTKQQSGHDDELCCIKRHPVVAPYHNGRKGGVQQSVAINFTEIGKRGGGEERKKVPHFFRVKVKRGKKYQIKKKP